MHQESAYNKSRLAEKREIYKSQFNRSKDEEKWASAFKSVTLHNELTGSNSLEAALPTDRTSFKPIADKELF